MNRKYTKEQYLEKIYMLKDIVPDIAITSDIIVGFPGETDKDFEETLDVMNKVQFDDTFSFCYADRPFAPSKDYKDKVPQKIKLKRLYVLQQKQRELSLAKNKSLEGKRIEVLIEGQSPKEPGKIIGKTRTNKVVHMEGDLCLKGRTVLVEIKKAHIHSLTGTIVKA